MKHSVNFDTLVDAYFDHARYQNSAPGLSDYHALKKQLLERLFECSIEEHVRDNEASRAEFLDRTRVRLIMEACLSGAAELGSPFDGVLEGRPGAMGRMLRDGHEAEVAAAVRAMKVRLRRTFRDALAAFFPEAVAKTFPESALHERGLPEEAPDPIDFY